MRLTSILTVLAALLFAAMVWHSRSLQPTIPQLQLTFTPEAFLAVVSQWSSAELDRFHEHFFIDFFYLVVYGVWGWVMVHQSVWFKMGDSSLIRRWAWCTPLASCMDALENILHLHLVFTPGPFHPLEYLLAGSVATAKWLLLLLFGLKLLALIVARRAATRLPPLERTPGRSQGCSTPRATKGPFQAPGGLPRSDRSGGSQ